MDGAYLDVPDNWKTDTFANLPRSRNFIKKQHWRRRNFGYSGYTSLVGCAMACYNSEECFAFEYNTHPGLRGYIVHRIPDWWYAADPGHCALLEKPTKLSEKINSLYNISWVPPTMKPFRWYTNGPGYISGLKSCLKGKSTKKSRISSD